MNQMYSMRKYLLGFALLGIGSLSINAQTTIPNMDLEQWTNHTYYDQPAGGYWATANTIVDLLPAIIPPTTTKSTDAHGGQYSARMESKNWPVANILMSGTLATGIFDNQTSSTADALKLGMPFTGRPANFAGWYKYTSVQQDSAALYALLTKWNGTARDTIGFAARFEKSTVSSWTEFILPFDYHSMDTPDSISIVFTSSADGQNLAGQVGSTLWVDDISFTTATGMTQVLMPENHVSIIPNPVMDVARFKFAKSIEEGTLQLFDNTGKLAKTIQVNGENASANVSEMAAGVYHMILTENNTATFSSKFVKQ